MVWQVAFYTSREDNAAVQGASHVVFLLTGMDGSLGPVEIPKAAGAKFARGSITDYDARADDLGELIKLQVWLVEKSGAVSIPEGLAATSMAAEIAASLATCTCGIKAIRAHVLVKHADHAG